MIRIVLRMTKYFALASTLAWSPSAFAQMPEHLRFADDTPGAQKTVELNASSTGYTVSLLENNKNTILLQKAKCKELAMGYHCYIRPVRVRGILVTDVNVIKTDSSFYDIKKIVLIDGSFTAIAEIGKTFVLENGAKASLQK